MQSWSVLNLRIFSEVTFGGIVVALGCEHWPIQINSRPDLKYWRLLSKTNTQVNIFSHQQSAGIRQVRTWVLMVTNVCFLRDSLACCLWFMFAAGFIWLWFRASSLCWRAPKLNFYTSRTCHFTPAKMDIYYKVKQKQWTNRDVFKHI